MSGTVYPVERPLKVSLSGIDGSGKSTSASEVSRRLASEGFTVVHALRRAYVDRPGRAREFFADRVHDLVDRAHRGLDRRGWRTGVGVTNVLYARIWRAVEARAIERFRPDVVLNGRSAVLDSAVYAPFYFPVSAALPAAWRLALSEVVASPVPADLCFLLDVPAAVAHRRILARIAEERAGGAGDREKWPHMHETPERLAGLRSDFARCAAAMPTPVVLVDAGRSRVAVVEAIVSAIRARLPSPRSGFPDEPVWDAGHAGEDAGR